MGGTVGDGSEGTGTDRAGTDRAGTGAGATDEVLRRRLHMRSIRRGTREMDLILAAFAARNLPLMGPEELAAYDRLLGESDPDLYAWIVGRSPAPPHHAALVARIAAGAEGLTRPEV